MTSAANVHAFFLGLDYLDQIPVDVIRRWSAKDLESAARWARLWDLWTADVIDYPLPDPPPVLLPYLPVNFPRWKRDGPHR